MSLQNQRKEQENMQENKQTVILASGSPRRKELLGMIFDEFRVILSDCEELVTSTRPEEVTKELSRQKAEAVAAAGEAGGVADAIIIGADTVVSAGGEILGKPKDRADAFAMLKLLSGASHQVITGVTLLRMGAAGEIVWQKSFAETTTVRVAELTDEEIDRYLDTDEPYDKAGAYGIQGMFGRHISGIEGDYNNVVGLPVHRLYMELKKCLDRHI